MPCKRIPQVTRNLLPLPLPPNLDRFLRWIESGFVSSSFDLYTIDFLLGV